MIDFKQNKEPKPLYSLLSEERGGATIEFMICLPLILIAFVFVLEFSMLFWAHHVASNNVRSATRFLTRAPLVEPFLTQSENMARTGNTATAIGAYKWMTGMNINVDTSFNNFTEDDFRNNGHTLRIRADVPYTFMTFDMMNELSGGSVGTAISFSIVEEARYIGD